MPGFPYVTAASLAQRTEAWLAACRPWARDRALPPLERSALLVLDVQRFFAERESHAYVPALHAVLPTIQATIDRFRQLGRPVVFTRQGTCEPPKSSLMGRWWRDELRRGDPRGDLALLDANQADWMLDKGRYSAFVGTELEHWLRQRACDAVVICGVMTHLCCESTARDAFMRDITPVVLADACAAPDEELHLGSLRTLSHGFAIVTSLRRLLSATDDDAPPEPPLTSRPLPPVVDLLVVGAGPCGLAAAIQTRRTGLSVLVVDRESPGGHALTANHVENYPGFPGGISGRSLMHRFRIQAHSEHVDFRQGDVTTVDARDATGLSAWLTAGETIRARTVLLATGTRPHGLRCATSGFVSRLDRISNVRRKRLLVVGGGETAFDQALMAHGRGAAGVTVALRGHAPRAMALLVDRARQAGIQIWSDSEIVAVEEVGPPLVLTLRSGDLCRRLSVDHVVSCIGRSPQWPTLPATVALRHKLPDLDEIGRTSVPGLYIAGDARRGRYRQIGIAVGDGLVVAMDVQHYLDTRMWLWCQRSTPAMTVGDGESISSDE